MCFNWVITVHYNRYGLWCFLGGIISRGITEIAGESASGKTQLCMQLCLTVQLPLQLGGLNGGTFYTSTDDLFVPLGLN